MKRLLIISIVLCLAGFVFADAGDMSNALYEFGACEGGPLFVNQSTRAGTTLDIQTEYTTGVVGACVKIENAGGRIEGSTVRPNITFAGLSGTDVDFSFYFKITTAKESSYPQLALRQDPNPTNGEVNDCAAYVNWDNSNWTYDSAWHQYDLDISTLNWDGVTTGDFFVNCYFAKTYYIDEIVLRDPTPTDASDDVWNAFASIGDCEADVWVEPTVSNGNVPLEDAQTSATGVVGQCCKLVTPAAWNRTQASTVDVATAGLLSESDAVLKFFYKCNGGLYGSYPYMYLRQDVTDNNADVHPDQGGTKVANWNAAGTGTGIGGEAFIRDNAWHLFQPNITDFFWTGQTADLVLNYIAHDDGQPGLLCIDEISLTDDTPPATRITDWGLY